MKYSGTVSAIMLLIIYNVLLSMVFIHNNNKYEKINDVQHTYTICNYTESCVPKYTMTNCQCGSLTYNQYVNFKSSFGLPLLNSTHCFDTFDSFCIMFMNRMNNYINNLNDDKFTDRVLFIAVGYAIGNTLLLLIVSSCFRKDRKVKNVVMQTIKVPQ